MLRSDASGMTPGRAARVHIQVRNRDYAGAGGLSVWPIFNDCALMVPALPAGFWNRFHPDGTIDTTAPIGNGWTAVGGPRALEAPGPSATSPMAVSWDWPQASVIAANSHFCIFAVVHGPGAYAIAAQVAASGADPTSVDALVPRVPQLGQRNVIWLPPGAPPGPPIPWHGEPGVAMVALRFHNPLPREVIAAFDFTGVALPEFAHLTIGAAGRSARLLLQGKVSRGEGQEPFQDERARFAALEKHEDHDRDDRHLHLHAVGGRVHLSGVPLPEGAGGLLVVAVRLPRGVALERARAVDAVQQVEDGKGGRIVGGAKLIVGGGPYLE